MTETLFCLPDLGEGLTEAEIVSWHVAAGDRIVADQPLVTVETDKAVVDIPSPRGGVIEAYIGEPGEVISVGAPLVRFSVDGERADQAAVVGELPEAESKPLAAPVIPVSSPGQQGRVRAAPRARARARALGVDLALVAPSGPDGVIQLSDVETAAGGSTRPISGVRRAMAKRMADAHARVVRASVTGEADVSAWLTSGSPILRLIRAIAKAVEAAPVLNAWFDDVAGSITLQTSVNVGIAMETADGLFVPVLEDVQGKDALVLAAELDTLGRAVNDRSIRPESMRGQTITLSNFGALGGLHAELVVVPPQVAIVGAGRRFERLVLNDGELITALVLPLSISFDHRVITGAEACTFLNALTDDLERDG